MQSEADLTASPARLLPAQIACYWIFRLPIALASSFGASNIVSEEFSNQVSILVLASIIAH